MKRKIYFFSLFLLLGLSGIFAQVELVPLDNPVYEYLDRMMTRKVIDNYSSSMLPISRREIGRFLIVINSKKSKISSSDKKLLDYYLVEFEYDTY